MDMTYFTQGRTNPNRKATMPNLKDEIVQTGVEAGEQAPVEVVLSEAFVDALGEFAVASYATMLICSHAPGLAPDVKSILETQVDAAPRAVKVGGSLAVIQLLDHIKKHPELA